MSNAPRAAIFAMLRPLIEPHIGDLEVDWWTDAESAAAVAPHAEIGWFDMFDKQAMCDAIGKATSLKWLNSVYAGIDEFPLDQLKERGVTITNGTGINAIPVAEYAVAGMLTLAKRLDEIVRSHDRKVWPGDSPGKRELFESKALIIGYGAIGRRIAQMLSGFEVDVTAVRRSPDSDPKVIGLDQWRARLGEFDWVILAAPSTDETERMIGAEELAAMKSEAMLINIARGSLIDQQALKEALESSAVAGAFLDTTTPEPLPPEDPLWDAPNTLVTMHMSGRSQTRMFERAAKRFVENLERYRRGEPMVGVANPVLGY